MEHDATTEDRPGTALVVIVEAANEIQAAQMHLDGARIKLKRRLREARDEGFSLAQLGEALGVSRERIRQLTDETQHAGMEAAFGPPPAPAPVSTPAPVRPVTPRGERLDGRRRKPSSEQRRKKIARLWHVGAKIREIAAEVGASPNAVGAEITRMRADGWDLAPRQRPKGRTEAP